MMLKTALLASLAIGALSLPAIAQVPIPAPQIAVTSFADEDRDFGVAETHLARRKNLGAPTPKTIPGARVIKTLQLKDR